MSKLVQPVFILQDTRENTLIIAKKCERQKTAACNGESQWFSSSKVDQHVARVVAFIDILVLIQEFGLFWAK